MTVKIKRLQENTIQKQVPLRLVDGLHELISRNAVKDGESVNLVINKILLAHYDVNELSHTEKPQT